ncbi:MAG: hypothetical protein JW937_07370 [Candidatus Omnitrophica bacterium]|nr:hypothetical protein [Candidatus Omnitrophota bacterium]
MLKVTVVDLQRTLFQGQATRVICPGESGVFEIARFHRPLLSRLLSGTLVVDEQPFAIRRGIAKVLNDEVTLVVETDFERKL